MNDWMIYIYNGEENGWIKYGWMDGWQRGWMDGRMVRWWRDWMDGQIDIEMDG